MLCQSPKPWWAGFSVNRVRPWNSFAIRYTAESQNPLWDARHVCCKRDAAGYDTASRQRRKPAWAAGRSWLRGAVVRQESREFECRPPTRSLKWLDGSIEEDVGSQP